MTIQTTPDGVDFLRTPDERFVDLPDFPYTPRYLEVEGLRMAYLDEGAGTAGTLLLLHGEPTWSYLYRRMIPVLVDAGHRIIAPDLIGFGRSDKPTDRSSYTYAAHVRWLTDFLQQLDAAPFDLFCQDWGGLIGLRVAAQHPEWFDRLVIANTALPVGESLGGGFDMWLAMSQEMPEMDAGGLVAQTVSARDLTEGEIEAYRAPFPDERYAAGAREFPVLVPITPDDPGVPANLEAWKVLDRWDKPVLTQWAPGDFVLGEQQSVFVDRIPGAAGQPHAAYEPAGHFIQDDRGEEVAAAVVAWIDGLEGRRG